MTWAELTPEQKAVACARSYKVKLQRQLAQYAAEGKPLDTVLAHIAEQDTIIASNGGTVKASRQAATITSADPLKAFLATKFAELEDGLRKQYYAEHPEAALPANLQAMTGKALTDYIAAERVKLTTYAAAAIKMCERDDKRAAKQAAVIAAAEVEAANAEAAEAQRIRDIEDANAKLKVLADRRNHR
jgi:hypothetical protein